MTDTEYSTILRSSIRKLRSLLQERDEKELEISKVRQFVRATVNMLPDKERQQMERSLSIIDSSDMANRMGLADAVKNVLERAPRQWFTVAQVRDVLRDTGFDFSGYTSNPLSSVSTTLNRIKSRDIERAEIDGVNAYRWKDTKAARKRKAARTQMDSILEELKSYEPHSGWKAIPIVADGVDKSTDTEEEPEKED
jgi:hypothetical protein